MFFLPISILSLAASALAAPAVKRHHEVANYHESYTPEYKHYTKGEYHPHPKTYSTHKYSYDHDYHYKPKHEYHYRPKYDYDYKPKYRHDYKPKCEEHCHCRLPPKEVPWYNDYYKWAYGHNSWEKPSEYKYQYDYKEHDHKKDYDYKPDYSDYKPKHEHKWDYKPDYNGYKPKHEHKWDYKPDYNEYKPKHEHKGDYKPDHSWPHKWSVETFKKWFPTNL